MNQQTNWQTKHPTSWLNNTNQCTNQTTHELTDETTAAQYHPPASTPQLLRKQHNYSGNKRNNVADTTYSRSGIVGLLPIGCHLRFVKKVVIQCFYVTSLSGWVIGILRCNQVWEGSVSNNTQFVTGYTFDRFISLLASSLFFSFFSECLKTVKLNSNWESKNATSFHSYGPHYRSESQRPHQQQLNQTKKKWGTYKYVNRTVNLTTYIINILKLTSNSQTSEK